MRRVSVHAAVVAALASATATLYAVQTEPAKKPDAAKPAEVKPAEAEPAGEKAADAKAQEAKPADPSKAPAGVAGTEPGVAGPAECAGSLPDSGQYDFDELLPGVSYEKAMDSDLGAHPWQRARQFHRLQQEIEKRVKLTPAQKGLVNDRFEQIYAQMLKYPIRSAWGGYRYRKLSDEERHNFENELKVAEAAGDTARAEKIRARIAMGTFGSDPNIAPPLDYAVLSLKSSLDPDQQETFQYVYDRWFGLEARAPFDITLRMLNRAIKDPDLKLDPEIQKKAQLVIEETYAALPPASERRKVVGKAGEEAKEKILALLPAEQRVAVEKSVAEAEAERDAVDRYSKELFQRRMAEQNSKGTGSHSD